MLSWRLCRGRPVGGSPATTGASGSPRQASGGRVRASGGRVRASGGTVGRVRVGQSEGWSFIFIRDVW